MLLSANGLFLFGRLRAGPASTRTVRPQYASGVAMLRCGTPRAGRPCDHDHDSYGRKRVGGNFAFLHQSTKVVLCSYGYVAACSVQCSSVRAVHSGSKVLKIRQNFCEKNREIWRLLLSLHQFDKFLFIVNCIYLFTLKYTISAQTKRLSKSYWSILVLLDRSAQSGMPTGGTAKPPKQIHEKALYTHTLSLESATAKTTHLLSDVLCLFNLNRDVPLGFQVCDLFTLIIFK